MTTVLEYSVIIHEAEEGGHWVEVPALPDATLKENLSRRRLRT